MVAHGWVDPKIATAVISNPANRFDKPDAPATR